MFVRVLGFGAVRSSLNPTLCGHCEVIVKQYQVGAEVPLTLLFADVRDSTAIAEGIGTSAFHHLINRFYTKRVLGELAAHYDSVPFGPDASDDGAGTAAILGCPGDPG